jgi:hypothetical protein
MESLSTQLYKQIAETIEKSDNILGDLQKLGAPNDIIYGLLSRDKQWAVICHDYINDGDHCDMKFACFMAKTKEDAIRQFIKTKDNSILCLLSLQWCEEVFHTIYPIMYQDIDDIDGDEVKEAAFYDTYGAEILDCLLRYPSEFRFRCEEICNGVI